MTLTIIIIAYIANIFLSRWLNYKVWKIEKHAPIAPIVWFIPIAPIIAFPILIIEKKFNKDNWFTGKYWK